MAVLRLSGEWVALTARATHSQAVGREGGREERTGKEKERNMNKLQTF